jgi:hypothetical protein
MPDEHPIACSLSAGELSTRLDEIAAVGHDALDSVRTTGARSVLRFRPEQGVRGRLESIVAAEAECCAFLSLGLRDEAGALVLTIEAPAEAEPVVAEMVAAFAS